MAYAFFRMPSDASPAVASELNNFLRTHRIIGVTKEWLAGRESCWAFCIEYSETGSAGGAASDMSFGSKIDYRDVLPPAEFAVFSRLRELRKKLSERDGQPLFAVFTNGQLAEMVKRGCRTPADLKAIAGIGDARVAKYGADVIAALMEGSASS